MCRELGLRICCGSGNGDNTAAPTRYGVSGRGKAVVHCALLPLATLGVVDNAVRVCYNQSLPVGNH